MPEPIYKYSIKAVLGQLDYHEQGILRQKMATALNITKGYLSKLINARQNDNRNLTAHQALVIANELGVTMEEIVQPYQKTAA